jgi:hypothetical protein
MSLPAGLPANDPPPQRKSDDDARGHRVAGESALSRCAGPPSKDGKIVREYEVFDTKNLLDTIDNTEFGMHHSPLATSG